MHVSYPVVVTGPYEKELQAGKEIARAAGQVAREMRQRGIGYESKADESPVTAADRECERLIVERLTQAFPEDGLLGEEGTVRESANGRKWIIDPIDGTRDFIRGTRAWSVLIALEERDEVVAGFAYFPSYDELFYAAKGEGAWWVTNDGATPERMQVSKIGKMTDALVCVNGLSFINRYAFANDLLKFMEDTWGVRSMGGCLDAMLVASGRADVWIEAKAQPWDLAPLKIIAEEAGAVTFDFQGASTIYGGNFAITNPALEDDLRRFLGRTERV